ncbi:MAG: hypothetical protein ACREOY_09460 [Candidatus Dormibacteraceae bacterium]
MTIEIALIAAGSSIAGAIVGGLISYLTQDKLLGRQLGEAKAARETQRKHALDDYQRDALVKLLDAINDYSAAVGRELNEMSADPLGHASTRGLCDAYFDGGVHAVVIYEGAGAPLLPVANPFMQVHKEVTAAIGDRLRELT